LCPAFSFTFVLQAALEIVKAVALLIAGISLLAA
jgi:hypothetical protein